MPSMNPRPISRSACRVLLLLLALPLAVAADKKPEKTVDSGSFGIFVAGRRIGTESFTIQQGPEGSSTRSEIKIGEGANAAEQTCDLELTAAGELRRYTWNEQSPGKAQATVVPSEQFLVETMTPAPGEKPLEQPFILPPSTMILDDYFFVQRQLLAWRYLAASCHPDQGQNRCPLTPSKFGVLVPRQRTSLIVSMEYGGREKVVVHGQERELNRFNLNSEGNNSWTLWLDDNYRLIRVLITGENTEVVRD
jgi:hypothetical protein